MNTGLRLEDLEADLLFNVAVAELYRIAELTPETQLARAEIDKAIAALVYQTETGIPAGMEEWGVLPADELLRADGTPAIFQPPTQQAPAPPPPPNGNSLGPVMPGRQMGSFDDLVLPEDRAAG